MDLAGVQPVLRVPPKRNLQKKALHPPPLLTSLKSDGIHDEHAHQQEAGQQPYIGLPFMPDKDVTKFSFFVL